MEKLFPFQQFVIEKQLSLSRTDISWSLPVNRNTADAKDNFQYADCFPYIFGQYGDAIQINNYSTIIRKKSENVIDESLECRRRVA